MRYTRLSEEEYYRIIERAEEAGYLTKEIEALENLQRLNLPKKLEDLIYDIIVTKPIKKEEV